MPTSDATMPASRLPSAGVPATCASSIPDRRPRIESGVDLEQDRRAQDRADEVGGAARARASRARAGLLVANPKAAIATPHPAAATQTPSPCRRTRVIQPEKSDATSAPADGAAYSSPTVEAPPPSASPNAGKSALGIPKIIATVSTVKIPSSAGSRTTSRNPSRIERRLGDSPRPRSSAGAAAARSRRARRRTSRGRSA